MALWKNTEASDWATAWASYASVVAAQPKVDLVELDTWIQSELPTTLHGRDPNPFLTQSELVKLMEWKLKKGKWRPQLMKFVKDLSDTQVQNASTAAFKELKSGHIKAAIEALAALKGVGPATASAVLSAYDESVPFMGDEALEAIASIIGARKYTLPHYLSFHKELTSKAQWIKSQVDDSEKEQWTAQRVQLCLYAEAKGAGKTSGKTIAKPPAKAPSTKRKSPNAEKVEAESDKEALTEQDTTTSDRRTRRKTALYTT